MSNDTMRAICYSDYGGPERLELREVPRPTVQPGTLLVRVKAAGVNPMDWKLRSGMYRQVMPVQFPATPGLEFAGIVEEVGPGVTGFDKGQAVYGTGQATNAEYVVVPATSVAPKPPALTFEQAAAVPIGALTALRALDKAGIRAGQKVLVLGAAGGVGGMVVQLARERGADVTATASKGNSDYVTSLGAVRVIDYQAQPAESAVHGADVIIDTVGGETGKQALKALHPGGVFVTVAGQPPVEEAQKLGVTAEGAAPSDAARIGGMLQQISDGVEAGKLKVVVTNRFPLAEAARAHAFSETRHGRGRIILSVAD